MGFISSSSDVTALAKLTTLGRELIFSESSGNLISYFAVGDSNANYTISETLTSGTIPEIGGTLVNNKVIPGNYELKSKAFVTGTEKFKAIDDKSKSIVTTKISQGLNSITAGDVQLYVLNRTDTTALTNLFYTFGLPITDTEKRLYTSVASASGGFSDLAIADLNQDQIIAIAVNTNEYAEQIDGKTIKIDLPVSGHSATTISIYSTFAKTVESAADKDNLYSDSAKLSNKFGNNIAYLVSDFIQRPNNDLAKSWATGYNTYKPFTVGKKEQLNMIDNSRLSLVKDKIVGIAYLDKGFFIITDPTLVGMYVRNELFTASFDSIQSEVTQNIICRLERNEFYTSDNSTFTNDNSVSISEIGLYDSKKRLIAVAMLDRQVEKTKNNLIVIGMNITL